MPLTAVLPTSPVRTISAVDPLLQIKKSEDTLTFLIEGSATTLDADPLREVINVSLADASDIKNVVFDLSGAMPIYNIAGRIFDIASGVASKRKAPATSTILRMPWDFYEELRLTDKLPEPANIVRCNGLTIHLLENSALLAPAAAASITKTPPRPRVLVSYSGKIRALDSDTVFVSLFSREKDVDEIVGELDRRQFPEEELYVGQIFHYDVISTGIGITEVKIKPVPRFPIHSDDLLEIYERVKASLPPDDDEG
jgi:hypothetical protein